MKQLLTFSLLNYFSHVFCKFTSFTQLLELCFALFNHINLTIVSNSNKCDFFQGFLNLSWKRWKRVLFTRAVAIIPTFFVAFFNNMTDLSGMNDVLNAVMSLQLPFATIPTIAFTSNPQIMGEFVNGW